jgi:hypothetical protein
METANSDRFFEGEVNVTMKASNERIQHPKGSCSCYGT